MAKSTENNQIKGVTGMEMGRNVGGNCDGNDSSIDNDDDDDSGGKDDQDGGNNDGSGSSGRGAKSAENNQIKEGTAMKTATVTEIVTITVTMAAVTQQGQQWQCHIAGVVCLTKMQYFGLGGIGKVMPPLTFLPLMSCLR
jgi:hypothetical protein